MQEPLNLVGKLVYLRHMGGYQPDRVMHGIVIAHDQYGLSFISAEGGLESCKVQRVSEGFTVLIHYEDDQVIVNVINSMRSLLVSKVNLTAPARFGLEQSLASLTHMLEAKLEAQLRAEKKVIEDRPYQEQAFAPQGDGISPRVIVTVTGIDTEEVKSVIAQIKRCLGS